ncbi:MAG: hypothetical protein QXR39_06900 [Candidatus Methanomethylicia archaeon]
MGFRDDKLEFIAYYNVLEGIMNLSQNMPEITGIGELIDFKNIKIQNVKIKDLSNILKNSFENRVNEILEKIIEFKNCVTEEVLRCRSSFSVVKALRFLFEKANISEIWDYMFLSAKPDALKDIPIYVCYLDLSNEILNEGIQVEEFVKPLLNADFSKLHIKDNLLLRNIKALKGGKDDSIIEETTNIIVKNRKIEMSKMFSKMS